jgi:hypothetical protein
MPPTGYTEQALADYMHQELSHVGEDLGLSPTEGSYTEAVNDTLLALGIEDIAEVSGAAAIVRLRTVAKVYAWKRAIAAAAALYDMSDGTQTLKRSQILSHAKDALASAEAEAAPVLAEAGLGALVATVTRLTYTRDPYAYLTEEELAL